MNVEAILEQGNLCLSDIVVFKAVYAYVRKNPKLPLDYLVIKEILPKEIVINEALYFAAISRLQKLSYITIDRKGEKFDWLVVNLKLRKQPSLPSTASLPERMEEFKKWCYEQTEFHPFMIKTFYNWWSEYNIKTGIMRWEEEDFFEVGRRMATWRSRDIKNSVRYPEIQE